MSEQTLPAVAKNIYVTCKKCEKERYHKVLAHKSSTSAKIQCEVCKSIKTYSLKKTKTTASKTTKPRKRSTPSKWADVVLRLESETPEKYTIKGQFSKEALIQHPKFGEGLVLDSQSDRIVVLFSEGEKTLMHNRQ